MNNDTPKPDYLGQNVSELAKQRGHSLEDPNNPTSVQSEITRAVAKRLLPACIVTPALLWWLLLLGSHRGFYTIETCLVYFVFSVTVVFGVIVCINLRKLSLMDRERNKAQELLRLAKEAAENANRFKSGFFANISHEIRTPLTAINGFAELLLSSDRTEDERRNDARVIRRNGEHLLTLINDILDQSKIEAGKMSVEPILCDPATIVGEVCSMLRARAAEKNLSLDVTFEDPIPTKIRTDPMRLRQVLINIIANAIKFTREGGIRLNIAIRPSIGDPRPLLEVKITDTGIGITPEQQALLFKPFAQADVSISRHYGGSGLGLSISKHFAQALGGDITVTSQAQKGSTFTVTVATGNIAGVVMHERPQDAMDTADDFLGPKVRINGSVLVAEDGIDNQALIAAKLREAGLKVEIAPNGQIACDKVKAANPPFDLILMDVQMPLMDGFAATLQLRSRGYRGPIIALTANAAERDRTQCLNAGCNDFVTKPIKMEALFKAIGRYLRVVEVSKPTARTTESASAPVSRETLVQKFYQDLPAELEQIEQACEREDRVQLREAAQLILGKSSGAGFKEIAANAARLLHQAETEQSWETLRETGREFVRSCQPKTELQAA